MGNVFACCLASKATTRNTNQEAVRQVQHRTAQIKREASNSFVCAVQVRSLKHDIDAMAAIVRCAPTAPYDFVLLLEVVAALLQKANFHVFLPFRTALMDLLLALDTCGDACTGLAAFRSQCVGLLDLYVDKEYYASGWTEFQCTRVHLIELVQRHWPAAALPFLTHVYTATRSRSVSCSSNAQRVLRQSLLDKK